MIELGTSQALRPMAALGTPARAADELEFTAAAMSRRIKSSLPRPAGASTGTPQRPFRWES